MWTIVAMFVFNGLQAIAPSLSGQAAVVVNGILSLVAVYFHNNPVVPPQV